MDIFISWSGERSKVFANEFNTWIQCVLQATRPWISTHDIPGGSIWFTEISEQLAITKTGVICLTRENFRNEWILFETGALFKGLSHSRLHTILIDLEPGDIVRSPLTQINHAQANEAGIRKLVRDLNQQMGPSKLGPSTIDKIFEMYWPKFEELHKKAMMVSTNEKAETENNVSDRQMLEEILSAIRNRSSLSTQNIESNRSLLHFNELAHGLEARVADSNDKDLLRSARAQAELSLEELSRLTFHNVKDFPALAAIHRRFRDIIETIDMFS